VSAITEELVKKLNAITDAQTLIQEVFSRFGTRAAIGTSGQLTGSVMIDMAARSDQTPRVFTIDTGRLFPETLHFFEDLEKKYGLHIERFTPDQDKMNTMIKDHGEHLFFDSKEKQELCCHIRKVEPNERALASLDVWLTGLRVDQSAARSETLKIQIIEHGKEKRPILKIAPLIEWSEKDLRDYMAKHHVPINPLLTWSQNGWHYESLGCHTCTTPISPTEPRRAGRWRWFHEADDDKECGIHVVKRDEI
jgi:phosphoadenosine phosphosulfate reductase